MSESKAVVYTPIAIGPTWQRGDDGKFILPELTLGWDALAWTAQWLQHEDGSPWQFTPEQARFVLWWYAIDKNGRWVYRDGVFQRLKGHGKRPTRRRAFPDRNDRSVPVRRLARRWRPTGGP